MSGTPREQERRADQRRHVNSAGVLELIYQNDHKHDEAHRRLRHALTELEERVADGLRGLADKQQACHVRVSELAATPIDVNKMVFTPRIVIATVIMVVSIAGAMWTINGGLRSDVRDILTRMASEQRVADSNAKLIEQNSATINQSIQHNAREMQDAIASVTKRQDLLTLQYQQLSEQLTKLSALRER